MYGIKLEGESMAATVLLSTDQLQPDLLPEAYVIPRWYAAYTRARHEKRVADQLAQRTVQTFLPLYSSVRRWKDRRITLQLPLFPSYLFVRLALCDRLRVLQVPGVVRLVGFNGMPAALPPLEVEALQKALAQRVQAEPHPYLTAGGQVTIRSGPLQGLSGVLVRRKGAFRLVVSIHLISRSILVDADLADIEVGPGRPPQPSRSS